MPERETSPEAGRVIAYLTQSSDEANCGTCATSVSRSPAVLLKFHGESLRNLMLEKPAYRTATTLRSQCPGCPHHRFVSTFDGYIGRLP